MPTDLIALAGAIEKGIQCDVCGCNVVLTNPFSGHLTLVDADVHQGEGGTFTAHCKACQIAPSTNAASV